MMSEFTKGEWRILEGYGRSRGYAVQRGNSGGFVVQGVDDGVALADAYLIIAAPDLFNALETLTAYCALKGIPTDAAQAALTKARGGNNG
jgi:hypothetical protein